MKKSQLYLLAKDSYGIDANLLRHILRGLSLEKILNNGDGEDLPPNDISKVEKVFFELNQGRPLEYIINKADFYGKEFYVDENCLIPRNETELLVEEVIRLLKEKEFTHLIDVGTGSGCIPISIMLNTLWKGIVACLDISEKTLNVAKKNINNYQLPIEARLSDLLGYYKKEQKTTIKEGKLLITANLPYIGKKAILQPVDMVKRNEPHGALFGGETTGFEIYERFIGECLEIKKKFDIMSITAILEIGADQYFLSKKYLDDRRLVYNYTKDYNNIYRFITIHF